MRIYMLVADRAEWEDLVLFISEEDAIQASLQYKSRRVEIFEQKEGRPGFCPTYSYYKQGKLVNYNP
jgi:hypothetical protein